MRGTVRSTAIALLAATVSVAGASSSGGATATPSTPQHVAVAGFASPGGNGFSLVFGDGSVRPRPFGAASSLHPSSPVVAGARNRTGDGYWVVDAKGDVFPYGHTSPHGGTGGLSLYRPIVGMAASRSGGGYWLVASDGGVFAFGNADFHGTGTNMGRNEPFVGITANPNGGYWLVTRSGVVLAFPNGRYLEGVPKHEHAHDIVGLASTPAGNGYWIARRDGRVYNFGDAQHFGGVRPSACDRITAIVGNPAAEGYRLVTQSGRTYARGDAPGGSEPTGARRSCGNATAWIELPHTTIAEGTAVTGHVVFDNETGAPLRLHDHGCKVGWAVDIENDQHPSKIVFSQACSRGVTVVPIGEHQYRFTIPARRTSELPPDNYVVRFLRSGGRYPAVARVPVAIVAPS